MTRMTKKIKLYFYITFISFIMASILSYKLNLSGIAQADMIIEYKIYKVITSNLRIRQEPSISSKVIGNLSKDSLVYSHLDWRNSDNGAIFIPDKKDIIDGKSGTWINIYLHNSESIGYVFSGYLEDVSNNFNAELYNHPGFICSSPNKQSFECHNDHSYSFNDKIEDKTFSLQNVSKVFYYTLDCNGKKTFKEYQSYNEIKRNYGWPATQYWILIVDKEKKFPVQLYFGDTPWECGE